jgi:CheY-like chemotaxis protein
MALKVLYLDDEPDLCNIFQEEFSSSEVQVTIFSDVQQAIEAVQQFKPDLIFLDYRLPGTTGDQVAQQMPKEIPKYLISGDQTVDSSYTFQKIFNKPVDPEVIRALFEKFSKKS